MQNIVLIGTGGALGALLRYGLSGLAYRWLGETFPWGTLIVNLVGCFLIGLLWSVSEEASLSPAARIFLLTGTLGAFTTFSTFGLESFNLLRDGEIALALANILANNVIGLAAVIGGYFLARVTLGGAS